MFACIFLFFIVFAYDGYLWIVQVIRAFHPRKAYVMQNSLLATENNNPPSKNVLINLENTILDPEDSLFHNNEEKTESFSIPPAEELTALENEAQTIESVSLEKIEEVQAPTEIILPDFLAPIESEMNRESTASIKELPATIPEVATKEQETVEEIIPE